MPAQLAAIPLKLIQPHPKLAFRFRYDIDTLAESIGAMADENAPNGQLNPGRVVLREDDEGYYVYIGVRRFYALKSLFESTKDERFGVYNAYIDRGLSELQMFVRAKRENDEERGERQGLSVLEEVYGIGRIRDSIDPEGLEKDLRRLYDLAGRLNGERIRKLFEMEVAAHFKFKLAHIEKLGQVGDEREFYETAASIAGFGFSSDEMEEAAKVRGGAHLLPWFNRLFPDYEQQEHAAGAGKNPPQKPAKKSEQKKGEEEESSRGLVVHEVGVVLVACPICSGVNMVRMRGEIEATHLSSDPEGERSTQVAESVSRVSCECSTCHKEFQIFVKHLEGRTFAVEPSLLKKFREPKSTVELVDLHFDSKESVWLKVVDGKLAERVDTGGGG